MSDLYDHALIALAAYADLPIGRPNSNALIKAGFSERQAAIFSAKYRVVDQRPGLGGLSATVFEDVSNQRTILGIRGTELSLDDFKTDAVDIAIIGSFVQQVQFKSLKDLVGEWLRKGALSSQFTVAGHSLGGFLAIGLHVEFSNRITHTYPYNGPGLGGVKQFFIENKLSTFLPDGVIDPAKVSNIKAAAGISPIAGLGIPVAPPIRIQIENQLDIDQPITSISVVLNHGQQLLVDSLAFYSLISQIDAAASIDAIGLMLRRSGYRNADMLEDGLNALGHAFGMNLLTPTGDRDAYYSNIARVQDVLSSSGSEYRVRLLDDSREVLRLARQGTDEGLAYRLALKMLDPFAVVQPAGSYSDATRLSLALFDPLTGDGRITEQWLDDRARMLSVKNVLFDRDSLSGNPGEGEYVDLARPEGALVLHGATGDGPERPRRIVFGSAANDTLQSGDGGSHLYGDLGDDVLVAGRGKDYLEGGRGYDAYRLLSESEMGQRDSIFDVDGIGEVLLDDVTLTGGKWRGGNHYESEDGSVQFAVVGAGRGEGTLIINDQFVIRHFRNGSLGLQFDRMDLDATTGGFDSAGYQYHYRNDGFPIDGPQDDPAFDMGSDFGDEFEAGSYDENGEFVQGGSAGRFSGKAGNDLFLGSYRFGGDHADGGAGDDILDGGALGVDGPIEWAAGDTLIGGAGQDRLFGSEFDDRLIGDFEAVAGVAVDGANLPAFNIGFNDGLVRYDLNAGRFVFEEDSRRGVGVHQRMFTQAADAVRFALGLRGPQDVETAYDDLIIGGAGNDYIVGGNGSDALVGDEGDDELLGDNDAFLYRQAAGLDRENTGLGEYLPLLGLPGDDYLEGGDGNDLLQDLVHGSDSLYGGDGDDVLRDVDWLDAGPRFGFTEPFSATYNTLDGGAGNDSIGSSMPDGLQGSSDIDGGAGDDEIEFFGWTASIRGGEGNDTIQVLARSASVDGGEGDDVILVQGAQSLYLVTGRGRDTITLSVVEQATLDFSEWAEDASVDIHWDAWDARDVLPTRSGNDLVLENPVMAATVSLVEWFGRANAPGGSFSFGETVFSSEQLEAGIGHALMPRGDGELLFSSLERPTVLAGGGNDILLGRDAAVLAGGAGDDVLIARHGGLLAGGPGNDIIQADQPGLIVFNRGDGVDEVGLDEGTISLGGGIRVEDLAVSFGDDSISLEFGAGDAMVLYRNTDPGADGPADGLPDVQLQFVLEDGVVLRSLRGDIVENWHDKAVGGNVVVGLGRGEVGWLAEGMQAIDGSDYATALREVFVDEAPVVASALAPVGMSAGTVADITLPTGSFMDPDGDVLYFTVGPDAQADWPEWLAYDAGTTVLHAAPPSGVTGDFHVRVFAIDGHGLWSDGNLLIQVTAATEPDDGAGAADLPGSGSEANDPAPPEDSQAGQSGPGGQESPAEAGGDSGQQAAGDAEPVTSGDPVDDPVADEGVEADPVEGQAGTDEAGEAAQNPGALDQPAVTDEPDNPPANAAGEALDAIPQAASGDALTGPDNEASAVAEGSDAGFPAAGTGQQSGVGEPSVPAQGTQDAAPEPESPSGGQAAVAQAGAGPASGTQGNGGQSAIPDDRTQSSGEVQTPEDNPSGANAGGGTDQAANAVAIADVDNGIEQPDADTVASDETGDQPGMQAEPDPVVPPESGLAPPSLPAQPEESDVGAGATEVATADDQQAGGVVDVLPEASGQVVVPVAETHSNEGAGGNDVRVPSEPTDEEPAFAGSGAPVLAADMAQQENSPVPAMPSNASQAADSSASPSSPDDPQQGETTPVSSISDGVEPSPTVDAHASGSATMSEFQEGAADAGAAQGEASIPDVAGLQDHSVQVLPDIGLAGEAPDATRLPVSVALQESPAQAPQDQSAAGPLQADPAGAPIAFPDAVGGSGAVASDNAEGSGEAAQSSDISAVSLPEVPGPSLSGSPVVSTPAVPGPVDEAGAQDAAVADNVPVMVLGAWSESGVLQAPAAGLVQSPSAQFVAGTTGVSVTAPGEAAAPHGDEEALSDAGDDALDHRIEAMLQFSPLTDNASAAMTSSASVSAAGVVVGSDWLPPPIPSSWDLTQALLDFHLSDTRYAALGDAPTNPGEFPAAEPARFAGMLAVEPMSGYTPMPGMQVFSGLNDGMAFLGRL